MVGAVDHRNYGGTTAVLVREMLLLTALVSASVETWVFSVPSCAEEYPEALSKGNRSWLPQFCRSRMGPACFLLPSPAGPPLRCVIKSEAPGHGSSDAAKGLAMWAIWSQVLS